MKYFLSLFQIDREESLDEALLGATIIMVIIPALLILAGKAFGL